MQTIHRIKLALLTALALAVSLGLIACSDESLNSPADPAPQTSLDDQWQTQVDALRAEIGDEAMAELAPQLEQARAELGDTAAKHRGRIFLTYADTWFDDDYIYGEGWATVIGHYSILSESFVDYSVVPPIQYTTTALTDGGGDELVFESEGPALVSEDFTEVEFYGSAEWVGGTGRYANATGTTSYYGNASFVTATGWILQWGWIDLND